MPAPQDDKSENTTGLLDHRRTPEERALMLRLLGVTVTTLQERVALPEAALRPDGPETMTSAEGKTLPYFPLADDEEPDLPFRAIAIDAERREFYASVDERWLGPLGLPSDFHYPALLPDAGHDPVPRGPGEKVLKQLTSVVNAQEPRVYGKPLVRIRQDPTGAWRTASGDVVRQAHPADNRFAFGTRAWFFDLENRRFWISSDEPDHAKGPYKLPRGFQLGNVTALEAVGGPTGTAGDGVFVRPRPEGSDPE